MMRVFATFDVKAASYGRPMFLSTAGLATRMFVEACADPKSELAKYPADYSLFEIGSYDPATGVLEGMTPKVIMTASAAMDVARKEVEAKVEATR